MACQFFAACSFYPLSIVRHHFQYLYELFQQHPSHNRLRYFDLSEGRYKYTDGTDWEDDDDEQPLLPNLGFGGTGFPTLAQCILVQVNQMKYVEHAVY